MAHISQREARRLRKRVAELETVLNRHYRSWGSDFVGGTHLGTLPLPAIGDRLFGALEAARRLHHAVCINAHCDGVKFYALPVGDPL